MQDLERDEDVVTGEWLMRHGVAIPRASGVFQSETAWVKVDGHGAIVAAGEKDQTILAWLVEEKTLCNADVDYGIDFITCRSAYRAYKGERGYKSSLDFSLLSVNGGLSCEQAAQVFSLIRNRLGRRLWEVVEYACDTVRSPGCKENYHPPYRQAFSALGKSIETAVKEVKERRVSDDLQMEGLNKLLAQD